jgi:peroxiredoxin
VPAPEFELPAVDGRRVSLRALVGRGLPVLLIFSAPGCDHSDALLPQVARWQHQHRGCSQGKPNTRHQWLVN